MQNSKTKRSFNTRLLALVMSLVLLISVLPAGLFAVSADENQMTVASISDIHYFAKADMGNNSDALLSEMKSSKLQILQLHSLLDSALEAVKTHAQENGLKYLLIPGDLTYNGEKSGHEELAGILEQFEKDSGVKVFLINGNHDINNFSAVTYKDDTRQSAARTSSYEFADIYSSLVYGKTNIERYTPPKGKIAGMLSYAVSLEGGYRLIAIDAGKYSPDSTSSAAYEEETGGNISPALMTWIVDQMKKAEANGETVIGMTHWGVVEQNYLQSTIMQGFVMDNRVKTKDKLADNGMHFLFTGHSHSTDISVAYSDNGEPLYNIQTATLTDFPNQFRETTFTKNNDGSVSADFEVFDADCVTPITDGTTVYDQPYRETASFRISHANSNSTDFVLEIVDKYFGESMNDITKKGGILEYLKEYQKIDVELLVQSIPLIDVKIPGTDIKLFSSNNIMTFIRDLADQIDNRYILKPAYTYSLIKTSVTSLLNTPVSTEKCTKFLDTLGFGSYDKEGTLGDAIFSCMAYMYQGNEDINDDAFMSSIVDNQARGIIAKTVVDKLFSIVLDDLLMNNILKTLKVNLDKLFVDYPTFIGTTAQSALLLFLKWDTSYYCFIDKVLGLLDLPYGKSLIEVRDYLYKTLFTDSQFEGTGTVLTKIIEGCCVDYTRDYDCTYTYEGAYDIAPTQDDFQIPSMATVVFGTDPKTSFNLNWYTKYSATNSDIELVKASGKTPVFTGKPTTGDNIKATAKTVTLEYPGVDLGLAGFFPQQLELVRHTIKVTGLKAGEKYYFRIGDSQMNWWSDIGLLGGSKNDDSFRFMFASDTQSQSKAQYANSWGAIATKAVEKYNDFDFLIHGGDFTDNAMNANQWQWCLDSASDLLLKTPVVPVAGNHEVMNNATNVLSSYFNFNYSYDYPKQDASSGMYYSFEYENAYFAVLNSNDQTNKGELSSKQIKWLKEDIAKTKADWKIVAIHKAPYANSIHMSDKEINALRAQMATLMTELKIDLVLQGHEHVYMRTEVLKDNKIQPTTNSIVYIDPSNVPSIVNPDGTVYVINGAAGVKHYPQASESQVSAVMPKPKVSIDTNKPMFASVKVEDDMLYYEAYAYDRATDTINRLDQFALQRGSIEVYLGDVNFDKLITAVDARKVLRASAELDKLTDAQFKVADVDFDGVITAKDARIILRVSAELDTFSQKTIRIRVNNPDIYYDLNF